MNSDTKTKTEATTNAQQAQNSPITVRKAVNMAIIGSASAVTRCIEEIKKN